MALRGLPITDLERWLIGRTAILSVDVDYFMSDPEHDLADILSDFVLRLMRTGTNLTCDDHHVALADLPVFPVDIVVNFDFHMDCRLEYLFGDAARVPPCNATVFEHLLSSGQLSRYIWALPEERYKDAADAYCRALILQRQPWLSNIHCITGREVLDSLLPLVDIRHIFVCRSPEYRTAFTDALYGRLTAPAGA